ncbi:MAG: fatty acid desaturase family protein [Pseudomonadota bacterium]
MKVSDYLTREEVTYFTSKSDWHAVLMLVMNWFFIVAIFALIAVYPNILTITAALILFAGQQLGLSVLMHDCGHNIFFRSKRVNDVVGQWFCALPVLNDQPTYAKGHLEHHRKAGSEQDPDLPNFAAYPVSKESFKRKVVRDLTGQTGYKLVSYVLKGAAGVFSKETRGGSWVFVREVAWQVALFLVLWSLGIGWTYLVWFASFMTVFMLMVRIRQVAEHAAVPGQFDPDVRMNTRTVDAPWWQRLLFAPNGVNFHLEHHFMASVPCYRLAELRRLLKRKGALDDVPVFRGYGDVLRHAVRA